MTDNSNSAPESGADDHAERESHQARLDRVLNTLGSRLNFAASLPLNVDVSTQTRPNLRYDSVRDVFINLDNGDTVPAAEIEAQAAAQPNAERVYDDGRNLQASAAQLLAEHKRLSDQLNEHTFDARTGTKVYRVQGSPRTALEAQLNSFGVAVADQMETYKRIAQQRENDRIAAEQAAEDEAAIEESIRRATQRRVHEMEVDERARKIIEEKRRRASGRSI